jgi:hypothetical protein
MIEGGCLCGAVRYRVHGTPQSSVVCHCASCRRASGATPVAWITVERAAFEILRGSPRAYRSSPGVTREFCAGCGSALTYATTRAPGHIDVTTATLDEPNAHPPTADVWLSDRLSWQPTDPAIGKFSGGSTSDDLSGSSGS